MNPETRRFTNATYTDRRRSLMSNAPDSNRQFGFGDRTARDEAITHQACRRVAQGAGFDWVGDRIVFTGGGN